MKICPRCKQAKPPEAYSKNTTEKGGFQSYCKVCKALLDRIGYQRHRVERVARQRELRAQNRVKLHAYLAAHPCIDCGERDIVVLDLDHTGNKHRAVSSMMSGNYPWSSLEREIQKCVVRCANCHRRKTAKEQGWSRQAGHQIAA